MTSAITPAPSNPTPTSSIVCLISMTCLSTQGMTYPVRMRATYPWLPDNDPNKREHADDQQHNRHHHGQCPGGLVGEGALLKMLEHLPVLDDRPKQAEHTKCDKAYRHHKTGAQRIQVFGWKVGVEQVKSLADTKPEADQRKGRTNPGHEGPICRFAGTLSSEFGRRVCAGPLFLHHHDRLLPRGRSS